MRRTFVYNPETKEMEEVTRGGGTTLIDAPMVHGDFKPVNVGGVIIEDRGRLRRYLKANNLAPYDPKAVAAARTRRDAAVKAERKRDLIGAYEHRRNQERARQRFG